MITPCFTDCLLSLVNMFSKSSVADLFCLLEDDLKVITNAYQTLKRYCRNTMQRVIDKCIQKWYSSLEKRNVLSFLYTFI